MQWDKLVKELQATGLSERTIGSRIGVSQSSIRNMRDRGGSPKWATGEALIALHNVLVGHKNRKIGRRKVKVA